jgi:hypothetical protein
MNFDRFILNVLSFYDKFLSHNVVSSISCHGWKSNSSNEYNGDRHWLHR